MSNQLDLITEFGIVSDEFITIINRSQDIVIDKDSPWSNMDYKVHLPNESRETEVFKVSKTGLVIFVDLTPEQVTVVSIDKCEHDTTYFTETIN